VQGTPGAAFHSALDIPHAALVLRKGMEATIDSYSAFHENDRTTPTGLSGYLRERGISRVFLAGLAFDFCVAGDGPAAAHARIWHNARNVFAAMHLWQCSASCVHRTKVVDSRENEAEHHKMDIDG
jgi:hypothetical protein